ncbi:MAG: TraR/DksA C4-type zinc finger protein [Chloroflexota bacterium]
MMQERTHNVNNVGSAGPVGAPKVSHVKEVLLALKEQLQTELQNQNGYVDDKHMGTNGHGEGARHEANYVQEQRDRHDAFLDRALEQNTRLHLEQVSEALSRLEDGKYGICGNCLQPISPERLVVRPYSTLCVSCQGILDSGKSLGPNAHGRKR